MIKLKIILYQEHNNLIDVGFIIDESWTSLVL